MNGFYSIWSKPYLESKKTTEYWMQDFEILTMVLSLLKWQELNGPVKMIGDQPALKYLESLSLLDLFQDGAEELVVDDDINGKVFWAAGKLYALRQMDKPAAMIDLDLIVWKNLDEWISKSDVLVIHREEITDEIYPDFSFFKMRDGYVFPKEWNRQIQPCNTALLYMEDLLFQKEYANTAIDFMKNCAEEKENLCHMVFAEQRLLPICAEMNHKKITSFYPLATDIGKQDFFTHVWGHKNILRYNFSEREKFCKRIMNRLKTEFPLAYAKMEQMETMQMYL